MNVSGFCTECGSRIESFEGLERCPACGTTGLPCRDADQVSVSVNWHELHLLCVWAENHQRRHPESCGRVVYAIARRLAAQHPDRQPLTLAGELGEIARTHGVSVSSPALRRDIAEQTGEETGLLRPEDTPDGS